MIRYEKMNFHNYRRVAIALTIRADAVRRIILSLLSRKEQATVRKPPALDLTVKHNLVYEETMHPTIWIILCLSFR